MKAANSDNWEKKLKNKLNYLLEKTFETEMMEDEEEEEKLDMEKIGHYAREKINRTFGREKKETNRTIESKEMFEKMLQVDRKVIQYTQMIIREKMRKDSITKNHANNRGNGPFKFTVREEELEEFEDYDMESYEEEDEEEVSDLTDESEFSDYDEDKQEYNKESEYSDYDEERVDPDSHPDEYTNGTYKEKEDNNLKQNSNEENPDEGISDYNEYPSYEESNYDNYDEYYDNEQENKKDPNLELNEEEEAPKKNIMAPDET